MTAIPVLQHTDATDDMVSVLRGAGAVVIKSVSTSALRDQIASELTPFVDSTPVETKVEDDAFYPGNARRVTALVRKSQGFHGLVLNPTLLALCDAALKPNCARYQLHVGAALVIGPVHASRSCIARTIPTRSLCRLAPI